MAKDSKILRFAKRRGYKVDDVTSLILRLLEANSEEPRKLAEIERCVDKNGDAWRIWCVYTGAPASQICPDVVQTRLF